MTTALIFIAVLFVLILVHEWGHYITAKWTGMRVDEFGIGFPPKLFGYKKGETEYSLNALPIGGFVRIYGEDPTQVENDPDRERSFSARPRWAQAVVLIAGVTMNVLLAWFLFVLVFLMGIPTAVEESAAGPDATLRVVEVTDGSALQGVVPVNANILSIVSVQGGESIDQLTPSALTEFVGHVGTKPIEIEYALGDEVSTVIVTPSAGTIPEDLDRVGLGVRTALIEEVRYGLFAAVVQATQQTYNMLVLIVVSIAGLIYAALVGTADFSQIAGPVGIFNLVGDAASVGITSLLLFTAVISLNLAIINLFPIPALDGGRLIFVTIESVIRRPIDPIWTSRLNILGFIFLIVLMIAVTYNDILRLI